MDKDKEHKTPPRGCDIEGYADLLNVHPDLLRELGLEDSPDYGESVRIPYYDETGAEVAARYRISIDGHDKFRVKKGQEPGLYGVNRLDGARRGNEIALVIGESDCIAFWAEGMPAVGLPTATGWDEALHARYFDGFQFINIVMNPRKGADAILAWLRESSIRKRAYLVSLPDDMDPADLRYADPMRFPDAWNDAADRAESWKEYAKRSETEAREAMKRAVYCPTPTC